MFGLFRLAGKMMRDFRNTPILSRDIIEQAKNRSRKMLNHIYLETGAEDLIKSRSLSENPKNVDYAYSIEQRLKALILEMGENRALTTADVTMSRLEGAWQLQQESHHDLANQYDKVVDKIRTLSGVIGFDNAIASADDVLIAVTNLDHRWRQIQNSLRKVTGALDSKNTQIQELAAFLGMKTSVYESSVFDDIKVRWTDRQSKFIDLEKALKEKQEESRLASQALQDIAKLMGVVRPENKDAFMDSITKIWTRTQKEITDLQQELFQKREEIKGYKGNLQNMAMFLGIAQTHGDAEKIVEAISAKWEESMSLLSQLRSSLILERDKNVQARETSQGLADFMGVETSGCESTLVGRMMDRWRESRREVTDLQRTLVEEKEKTQQVQEALQANLTRPGPVFASVSVQTDDNQAQLGGPEQLCDKSVQTDRDPKFHQKAEQELQQIEGHLSLSISYYRSHSFTSSELIHPGPCCRSLKTFSAGDALRLPSRSSLLRGASAIASKINCLQSPSNPSITVTKISDLIPWEESRSRIELGRGVDGTVFLFRHAVSKIPVAAKIVECPGECFRNEVRIHQAISGLPWFPKCYGSFDIAGDQAVLAMEFIGGESDDRSYTLTDCLDKSFLKTGPDLTRDEWFDVLNDVAEGLKALHSKGFLSNDLKEDNVLVVKEAGLWRAKIIDLGWASEIATPFVMDLDEDQIEFYEGGMRCLHIAPECVLDARPCSTSSDVYSLGRLLASVGRAMRYDDFQSHGMQIYLADEDQRPTVQEVIDKLYEMQLVGGGEDGPESSSC